MRTIFQYRDENNISAMSSVKRRKVGGDVPADIQKKASSNLASTASSSLDPEESNSALEDKTGGAEAPKTFKNLVCSLEKSKFENHH